MELNGVRGVHDTGRVCAAQRFRRQQARLQTAVLRACRVLTAMSRRQANGHECQSALCRTIMRTTVWSTKPRNAAPPLAAAVDRRGNGSLFHCEGSRRPITMCTLRMNPAGERRRD